MVSTAISQLDRRRYELRAIWGAVAFRRLMDVIQDVLLDLMEFEGQDNPFVAANLLLTSHVNETNVFLPAAVYCAAQELAAEC